MIGVGRVKTPTLAIICKRELKVRHFVMQAYFEVVATTVVEAGQLWMRPAPELRLLKCQDADAVAALAEGFAGPLAVKVEDKRQGPPRLHAVIPNANTVGNLKAIRPRLSGDKRRLFDVVARSYLAALMADYRYRQTTVTLDVHAHAFLASGRQAIEPRRRAAFPDWRPAEEWGEDAQPLPLLCHGETARLMDAAMEDNEGSLVEAMQNAWRFVADGPLRDRLREAKGIGTPATRAEVIRGLKA